MKHNFHTALQLMERVQDHISRLCMHKDDPLRKDLDEAVRNLKTFESETLLGLDHKEVELARQWFDGMQDLNPGYLIPADGKLAEDLYVALRMGVPASVRALANGQDLHRTTAAQPALAANYGQDQISGLLRRLAFLESRVRVIEHNQEQE